MEFKRLWTSLGLSISLECARPRLPVSCAFNIGSFRKGFACKISLFPITVDYGNFPCYHKEKYIFFGNGIISTGGDSPRAKSQLGEIPGPTDSLDGRRKLSFIVIGCFCYLCFREISTASESWEKAWRMFFNASKDPRTALSETTRSTYYETGNINY